jgi:hypothetical protein
MGIYNFDSARVPWRCLGHFSGPTVLPRSGLSIPQSETCMTSYGADKVPRSFGLASVLSTDGSDGVAGLARTRLLIYSNLP